MTKITKHLGIDTVANQRIALILPVLPGTEDCLVVHIDRLTGAVKEHFLNLLNTPEGQSSTNFSEVLGRRYHNDTAKSLLQVLHEQGSIKKQSIDTIMMSPTVAVNIPLRTVLVESGIIARPVGEPAKFNPHEHNANAAIHGEAVGTARNLLIEADMLEEAARSKREEAYRYAPTLRPGAAPEPVAEPEPLDLAAAFDESAKPAKAKRAPPATGE